MLHLLAYEALMYAVMPLPELQYMLLLLPEPPGANVPRWVVSHASDQSSFFPLASHKAINAWQAAIAIFLYASLLRR
jgi:hypothetical protein